MKVIDLQIWLYIKVLQRGKRLRISLWRLRRIRYWQMLNRLIQYYFVLRFENLGFSCLQFIKKSIVPLTYGVDDRATKGDRDVYNEKPTRDDRAAAEETKPTQTGTAAVMHTTLGDIFFKLFPEVAPKAVENFATHAKNGYYDGTIFHRVIPKYRLIARHLLTTGL